MRAPNDQRRLKAEVDAYLVSLRVPPKRPCGCSVKGVHKASCALAKEAAHAG